MLLPVLGLAGVLLSACGGSQDDAVQRAAERFHQAFAAHDGTATCALLAPRTRSSVAQSAGKPCAEAILEEQLAGSGDVDRVSVFGSEAQVRYADDSVFLSRYGEAWLVVATGCVPAGGDRYDCEVEAG